MSEPTYFGTSEVNHGCPLPPYNAMNFTPANPLMYSTMVSYASNSPNYPLPPNTDAAIIAQHRRNVAYYQSLNQQTSTVKGINTSHASTAPYPQFRSEGERLMYRQGLHATASRNALTGRNPSGPAGVPASTIYQIISQ